MIIDWRLVVRMLLDCMDVQRLRYVVRPGTGMQYSNINILITITLCIVCIPTLFADQCDTGHDVVTK